jgi:hypothetical protein
MVGGTIQIRYGPEADLVAVSPGDDIYPTDVRTDSARTHLYVKAQGLAGGISEQTWLYDYDLQQRRQVARLLVDPRGLPPECAMPSVR